MKNPGAWITTLAPLVALVWILAGALNPQRPWDAARTAGFVLAVVFLTLVFLARLQLGDSFSIAPQARKLVTKGIYSKVRHPVYVFGTLAILGIALHLHLWALLLVVLLIIPLQVVRARAEERVLHEKFGEEYLRYRSRTWF
jgi:protein-S-isoprenylcysteine O-methyltransferase Ste14